MDGAGLPAWQSQAESEKGEAPVAVAPAKLEKALTEETKDAKDAKDAKERKPAAPKAAPPPGPGLDVENMKKT